MPLKKEKIQAVGEKIWICWNAWLSFAGLGFVRSSHSKSIFVNKFQYLYFFWKQFIPILPMVFFEEVQNKVRSQKVYEAIAHVCFCLYKCCGINTKKWDKCPEKMSKAIKRTRTQENKVEKSTQKSRGK